MILFAMSIGAISHASAMMSFDGPSLLPNKTIVSDKGQELELFTGLLYTVSVKGGPSDGHVT